MAKRFVFILIGLLLAGIFTGCQPAEKSIPAQQISQNIKVYYGNSGNEKMVTEQRQIKYSKGEDKYKLSLEELLQGPANKNHRANIPAGTKVYGTIKQGDKLIVDFSSSFNRFSGSIAEIIGVGSVVNTMTQFKEIRQVKILVNGQEYIGPSGQPRGFMKTFPVNPSQEEARAITLYFGNKDATAVVPESRTIKVSPGISKEDFIKIVLGQLIKGPENTNLVRTIPQEAKVNSVMLKDKIAYVDFSEEMQTKHWHGAAGEAMTINSIVNTLTEFEYISKVKMTVAGQPLAIEHIIADQPIGRNESIIQK
ncbi:MAG TPA: GerMN domain-containing protein [Syntrophomonadaceae bacterium]|nr:GerMN domain-containing protein [Syntrophomonadaceae bacterium]